MYMENAFIIDTLPLPVTVNSHDSGHHRDQDLVSVMEKVRNSGSSFQYFFFAGTSASIPNNGVSVITRCPQGES